MLKTLSKNTLLILPLVLVFSLAGCKIQAISLFFLSFNDLLTTGF